MYFVKLVKNHMLSRYSKHSFIFVYFTFNVVRRVANLKISLVLRLYEFDCQYSAYFTCSISVNNSLSSCCQVGVRFESGHHRVIQETLEMVTTAAINVTLILRVVGMPTNINKDDNIHG